VPYLVARPLTWGLAEHPQVELVEAPPAQLAKMLRADALDTALASSVLALEDPPLDLWEEGPVIASDGPIHSVLLFLRPGLEDPKKIRSWAADPHSRTGQRLTRWLLTHAWQVDQAEAVALKEGADPFSLAVDAVQLIGDPALEAARRQPDWTVVDLGLVWQQTTHLPFVFAGWMSLPGTDLEGLRPILQEAAALGLEHREPLAEEAAAGDPAQQAFLRRYLCEDLRYALEPKVIEACLERLSRDRTAG